MDVAQERDQVVKEFWTNVNTLWDSRWEQVWAYFNAENKTPTPLLWEAIRRIPPSVGHVIEQYDCGDKRLIVILRSSPANADQQASAGKILRALVDTRCISFIPSAAGVGEYDLSIFTRIEDRAIRARVVDRFVQRLVVGPTEYACIMAARGAGVQMVMSSLNRNEVGN